MCCFLEEKNTKKKNHNPHWAQEKGSTVFTVISQLMQASANLPVVTSSILPALYVQTISVTFSFLNYKGTCICKADL